MKYTKKFLWFYLVTFVPFVLKYFHLGIPNEFSFMCAVRLR